ncbi:MAG: DNA methyltransferase [Solirubrobacteraceae bacterium]
MARLEDLIQNIEDSGLKAAIAHEVKTLKRRTAFGLVFERHIPETTLLAASVGVTVGDRVRIRDDEARRDLRVLARNNGSAVLVDDSGVQTEAEIAELLVVRGLGDTVYPTLTSLGTVDRGGERPYHAVINGENYHALQLLVHCWAGTVDFIYIDPPYNTGTSDWKYNNDYVDRNDSWRHSKWLSMMEKRLRQAKRLLNAAGVLVVTIDEHEVHHLGVLLEQLFPEYERQLVAIVTNPKGVTRPQGGLSRVEEYAFFCFPAGTVMESRGDDLLTPLPTGEDAELFAAGKPPRWQGLLHSGEGHRRQDRPTMFYPVFIDPDRGAVIGAGEPLLPIEHDDGSLEWPEPDLDAPVDGHVAVWPVRKDRSWGRWYIGADTLRDFTTKGYVRLGGYDPGRKTWAMQYLYRSLREQLADGRIEIVHHDEVKNVVELRYVDVATRRIKTVWHRTRHDAGSAGSELLSTLLGERRFDFPKSLYAVRDTLAAVVGKNKQARIVDFFAGSGTTLHATALLNAEDDGRRQCLLVTNNEVDLERHQELTQAGLRPGDPDYEAAGVFQAVTHPRVLGALTGIRVDDGAELPGAYLDGRPLAQGFDENCEFFELDYLNPDDIELGRAFATVHPLLWLTAGGVTARDDGVGDSQSFVIQETDGYAVLFAESALREFVAALYDAVSIEHVFLVTDSEDAFADMCQSLAAGVTPHMLYRDYLRSFRIHATPPA